MSIFNNAAMSQTGKAQGGNYLRARNPTEGGAARVRLKVLGYRQITAGKNDHDAFQMEFEYVEGDSTEHAPGDTVVHMVMTNFKQKYQEIKWFIKTTAQISDADLSPNSAMGPFLCNDDPNFMTSAMGIAFAQQFPAWAARVAAGTLPVVQPLRGTEIDATVTQKGDPDGKCFPNLTFTNVYPVGGQAAPAVKAAPVQAAPVQAAPVPPPPAPPPVADSPAPPPPAPPPAKDDRRILPESWDAAARAGTPPTAGWRYRDELIAAGAPER